MLVVVALALAAATTPALEGDAALAEGISLVEDGDAKAGIEKLRPLLGEQTSAAVNAKALLWMGRAHFQLHDEAKGRWFFAAALRSDIDVKFERPAPDDQKALLEELREVRKTRGPLKRLAEGQPPVVEESKPVDPMLWVGLIIAGGGLATVGAGAGLSFLSTLVEPPPPQQPQGGVLILNDGGPDSLLRSYLAASGVVLIGAGVMITVTGALITIPNVPE